MPPVEVNLIPRRRAVLPVAAAVRGRHPVLYAVLFAGIQFVILMLVTQQFRVKYPQNSATVGAAAFAIGKRRHGLLSVTARLSPGSGRA